MRHPEKNRPVCGPVTLLKKILWHRFFPVNFAKFLKTIFLIEQLQWLFLFFHSVRSWSSSETYIHERQICHLNVKETFFRVLFGFYYFFFAYIFTIKRNKALSCNFKCNSVYTVFILVSNRYEKSLLKFCTVME